MINVAFYPPHGSGGQAKKLCFLGKYKLKLIFPPGP